MDCQVSFTAFCNLCEHLASLGKIEHKKQKLAGFVDEWRRKDPASLFTFFRLLIPHVRKEIVNHVSFLFSYFSWIMKEKITESKRLNWQICTFQHWHCQRILKTLILCILGCKVSTVTLAKSCKTFWIEDLALRQKNQFLTRK